MVGVKVREKVGAAPRNLRVNLTRSFQILSELRLHCEHPCKHALVHHAFFAAMITITIIIFTITIVTNIIIVIMIIAAAPPA
jgi:hypothetical protein